MSDTAIPWDRLDQGHGSMVAVDEVSFEVGRAEILVAAGRNGADKTTPVECRQELRRADQVNCGCWTLTPLAEQDVSLRTVTFAVSVVHADRARLVFTPTGTGAAWSARVVAQDHTAADGLRLAWNPQGAVLGRLTVEALGPVGLPAGGSALSTARSTWAGPPGAPAAPAAGGALVPGRGSWRRCAERLYAETSAPRTLGMAVHKEVARHAQPRQA